MHACRKSRLRTFGAIALILSLPLSSALAVAALATYDLAGTLRATPQTTIGALEASDGLSPPKGLTLTIHRLSH